MPFYFFFFLTNICTITILIAVKIFLEKFPPGSLRAIVTLSPSYAQVSTDMISVTIDSFCQLQTFDTENKIVCAFVYSFFHLV